MSEAHTKLPLGKWSKTTCIDLNLKLPLKCHNCIAAEEQRSLCLRKSTKKRKRKNVKNVCTQPWSLSFKDSKELTKRNTYHKVWAYLILRCPISLIRFFSCVAFFVRFVCVCISRDNWSIELTRSSFLQTWELVLYAQTSKVY